MTLAQRGAEDYGTAVCSLQQASRGSYPGPSISPAMLGEALGSIDGLDTAALIEHFGAAAGNSETHGVREGLLPMVLSLLGQTAAGVLGGVLSDVAGDWFDGRGRAEELAEGSRDAAEAVDTVVTDADAAMSAVLSRALETLDLLLGYLGTIDPGQHPGQFRDTVNCAAEVIDQAGEMLTGTCAERDRVIDTCYEQLLETGKQICDRPPSQPPPQVAEGEPVQGKPAAPAAATEPPPPPKLQEVPEPPPPPKLTPTPEPEPPAAKPDPGTTPATLPEDVDCPPAEAPVPPLAEPTPAPAENPGEHCSGALGAVGAGVALLAIGFVVHCLTEAVECEIPERPPEPAAEPAPEPEPEPESDLAEVPEPPPPPKKIPPPAPEPVPDLAEVPEPPPPPKQQAESAPAVVAPSPMAPPPEMPEEAPDPAPPPVPAPQPEPEPVGVARKAGAW